MHTPFDDDQKLLAFDVDLAGAPDRHSVDSLSLWLSGLLENPFDCDIDPNAAEARMEVGDER